LRELGLSKGSTGSGDTYEVLLVYLHDAATADRWVRDVGIEVKNKDAAGKTRTSLMTVKEWGQTARAGDFAAVKSVLVRATVFPNMSSGKPQE
jgi:agmatine/peptidylarginine deiminase